jgi:8-oxo-dGTP diphosphatase
MTLHKNPAPTVDIIIELKEGIVLIERENPPYGYALPGGFIDEGESAEMAAIREAREETGLDVTLKELLYVYSDPGRDPRRHTMSVVYIATAEGSPVAGDDAKGATVVDPDSIGSAESAIAPLVFDHARIIADYVRFRKTGVRPNPDQFL